MDLSVSNNIWKIKEVSEKDSLFLSQKKGISSTLSDILISRGITVDTYEDFINPCLKNQMPDPYVLKDCEKACKIITDSILNNEKIAIYGDYDVDGGTSTATMVKFLRSVNVNVDFYVPNKLTEGYGPNSEAFNKLQNEGADLIVTVDCGISAFEPIKKATVKTIIIDHHMAEEILPEANAIVNPKRLDDDSGLESLAGVGVSFLVCVAINRELEKLGFFKDKNIEKPNLMNLLDLVALGTVCDVMKLTELNRVFVAQGLKILNKKTNCGLRALSDLLNINKKLDTYHLGFIFGPRINAGGRLGYPLLATQMLISEDYEEAYKFAQELNDLNETRKDIESKVCKEALEQLEEFIVDRELIKNNTFVYDPDWHTGVSGIVASRLKEKFNKPSFVVSCEEGIAYGSARSIPEVDLGALVVLAKQKGILRDGGGHKMAAGFSCDLENLEDFKTFLEKEIDKQINNKKIIRTVEINKVVSIKAANLDLLDEIELVAPFGNGNPKPKFCINDVKISKTIVLGGKHIKCFLTSPFSKGTLEAIIFNAIDTKLGNFLLEKHENPISLVGYIDRNSWNNRETAQLMIEDAKISD